MARIVVDGITHDVADGQHLLEACLSLGYDLPYFCWHPALGSVGACRQCAVKKFRSPEDTRGALVVACLEPATNGARISIANPEARAFRASVTEWLMLNHPHDCPVCDEGGECHLQDMTVMTGHAYRRFRGLKRTFQNQDLGPFVNHEMNRCIQCYRCVRFYRDYAGGRDLDAFALRDQVYFGRHQDGTLESEFSGNLVEVCPTGVFTDKALKQHYTRKWDLQTAPSVCVHCGLGCNTIPGARYGRLRRVRNRYHAAINGYFLCDRGRYGWDFVNLDGRVRTPLRRGPDGAPPEPIDRETVLRHVGTLLRDGRAIGIGSPRASIETNFALCRLVGPERFCQGLAARELRLLRVALDILAGGPAHIASLADAERADAVLVLGEDVPNTAPRLALALRQSVRQQPFEIARRLGIPWWNDAAVREAIQQARGPLAVASVSGTRLDDVASEIIRGAPDDLARLGFAVAHEVSEGAPAVAGLSDETRVRAARIAASLKTAARPLVVAGTGCGSQAVLEAAANIGRALRAEGRAAQLHLVLPESNSLGLALLGGLALEDAFTGIRNGAAATVIVVENDLFRRAETAWVRAFLDAAPHLVVIDHLPHDTAARAEVVLPAAPFAEADGTLVNSEGRAQRFFQVVEPAGDVQESWRWVRDVVAVLGRDDGAAWRCLDDVIADCARAVPAFAGLGTVAPPATFRLVGQKIPRQPFRWSGRTAISADVSVHEPAPPDDRDSPLAFSMEGHPDPAPAPLIPRYWAPGWNSVQALNKFQDEMGGELRGGDPGRRLLEPAAATGAPYFTGVPRPFERRPGEWLVVPLHHVFGSEELSARAAAVAQLAPGPYVALNPDDAAALGIAEGDEIALPLGSPACAALPVRLLPAMPCGLAGLPVGAPGLAGLVLPAWCKIARP